MPRPGVWVHATSSEARPGGVWGDGGREGGNPPDTQDKDQAGRRGLGTHQAAKILAPAALVAINVKVVEQYNEDGDDQGPGRQRAATTRPTTAAYDP